LIKRLQMLI